MSDVTRTLAAIDRVIAEWEAWVRAATVADRSRQPLDVTPQSGQRQVGPIADPAAPPAEVPQPRRRWLARFPLLHKERP